MSRRLILALAGGVGGGKLARGLSAVLPPDQLAIAVNTADDFVHLGLHVSPDIDSVLYALADLNDPERGWGLAGETWNVMTALERLGGETWFKLGDRDLATHILRTRELDAGRSLSEATALLAQRLGVAPEVMPMTDNPVRSVVQTDQGPLDFQDYFVRRHHADEALELRFSGAGDARPTSEVAQALGTAELIVIAPSNPFVSIGPILAVPGLLNLVLNASAPVVAVSPIVGGAAVRGPAADMMRTLGNQPGTAAGVAAHYHATYRGLVDVLVIDNADATESDAIARTGMRPLVTNTLIAVPDARRALAEELLALAGD